MPVGGGTIPLLMACIKISDNWLGYAYLDRKEMYLAWYNGSGFAYIFGKYNPGLAKQLVNITALGAVFAQLLSPLSLLFIVIMIGRFVSKLEKDGKS